MNLIERLARVPCLHYWEQRFVGFDFYHRVKSILRKEGLFHPGLKVLETGCGQGILANWFTNACYVGIDTDFQTLKFASSRFSDQHFFLHGDAMRIPFQNRAFDAVLSIGILHHLDDSGLRQHFLEAFRVLEKGGKLIVLDSLKPERNDFFRYGMAALERGTYLRTEEELRKIFPENLQRSYNFTPFNTIFLLNYVLKIQKPA